MSFHLFVQYDFMSLILVCTLKRNCVLLKNFMQSVIQLDSFLRKIQIYILQKNLLPEEALEIVMHIRH